MQYFESKEQSAEILRQVIPLMAKQEAGFNPASYAIWYEHVAGLNLELSQVLNQRLMENQPLTSTEIYQLFWQFIIDRDRRLVEQTELSLQQVIRNVEDSAIMFGVHTAQYGASLEECGALLAHPLEAATFSHLVSTLVGETTRMRGGVEQLQKKLESSKQEINQLRAKLEVAEGEALIDAMTGLQNRRALETALNHELASASGGGQTCCLILADIDHFKRINDTHGHLLGDKVIRAVAQIIKKCVKETDVAARFGGEEFAVLLPRTSAVNGVIVADRIRTTVSRGRIQRRDSAQDIGGVTISVGVAASMPNETMEQLISRADAALYESKNAGRNRVTRALDTTV